MRSSYICIISDDGVPEETLRVRAKIPVPLCDVLGINLIAELLSRNHIGKPQEKPQKLNTRM
jgi:hypothetical protein